MSMRAMVMGVLVADPVRRTSQAGKLFTTATTRVACEDAEPFLASLIAFGRSAAEALGAHQKGDKIVAGGRAGLKTWTGRDGSEQHGIGIVVEQIMSPYQFGKRRKGAAVPEGNE